jgi:hypothetical protein
VVDEVIGEVLDIVLMTSLSAAMQEKAKYLVFAAIDI